MELAEDAVGMQEYNEALADGEGARYSFDDGLAERGYAVELSAPRRSRTVF